MKKGIVLRTNKRCQRSILTLNGKLELSRYDLRPKTKDDYRKLLEQEGITVVVPLDYYLGLTKLPFKMTVDLMLEVAYWAQNQCSYQAAEEAISKVLGLEINDDTIRSVTNEIGAVIFDNDCKAAEETYEKITTGEMAFPRRQKDGVLYIEADGAALNTRQKDKDGSTWRENKLGIVFSSDNIRYWTDKQGDLQHKINKREYISYVGSVTEFQKHLLACAIRNGYGTYKQTVIISDGAAWIRNMKEELFPDAQQILDYYHLCENVNIFAKHIFKMDESKYKPWVDKMCQNLKKSKHKEVLDELESLVVNGKCPINLHKYIVNNINNIDYAAYQEKGYFIGSGAIESGNKIILQHRLKQAGMRWNTQTAQYLLTLKSKVESNLWLKDVVSPVKRYYGFI